MERLGISSEEDDGCGFGRVTDAVLLGPSFPTLSVSVPEAAAEDTDSNAPVFRRLTLGKDFRCPLRPSVLDEAGLSGDADKPTACAVD